MGLQEKQYTQMPIVENNMVDIIYVKFDNVDFEFFKKTFFDELRWTEGKHIHHGFY